MRFLTLAVAAAAVGASSFSSAQFNQVEDPYGISLRGGVVIPIDSRLRDLNDTLIGIGLDYTFDRPLFGGGETFLSIDWFGRAITGDKGNLFPININHRWYTGSRMFGDENVNSTYFFFGAGVVFMDVRRSDTVLGVRGGVGLDLSNNFFAEAALYFSAEGDGGVRSSAVGIYVGYRF